MFYFNQSLVLPVAFTTGNCTVWDTQCGHKHDIPTAVALHTINKKKEEEFILLHEQFLPKC